ncbi:MAG: histidine kinase [Bacteroidales bacterium]
MLRKGIIFFSIAAAVTLILLQVTGKYTFTLVDTNHTSNNITITYAELDSDNISERIELHKYLDGKSSLIVKSNEQVIDQWNFNGDFINSFKLLVHDFDADGKKEIFVFTSFHDSLYLHGIDAMNRKIEFLQIPVCKIIRLNGSYNYTIELIDYYDVDKDGTEEIFFNVSTGFTLTPRRVFAYNPATKVITGSAESCANLRSFMRFDLNEDSIPEYIGSSSATGNCDQSADYSDMYAWLMVFGPDLTFRFPPIKTGNYPSKTAIVPYGWNGKPAILAMHDYTGSEDEADYLAVFNALGKLVKQRDIADPDILTGSFLIPAGNSQQEPLILDESGTLYSIDEELELHKIRRLKGIRIIQPIFLDIDNDGKSEILFLQEERDGVVVYRSDFTHPAIIGFKGTPAFPYYSAYHDQEIKNALSVCLEDQHLVYAYHRSLAHRYWYILLVAVFLFSWALYMVLLKIREFREMKRTRAQEQLAELQMRSIQNQLDPHFIFNVLQSFGAMLNEADMEKANYLFDKYADLLKTTVLNSDKILVPLEEELSFIESYLWLERFRQQDRFVHSIEIGKNVEKSMLIPKMMIFTFVENAVKHGLWHRDPGGKLSIVASKANGHFRFTISDNGIGREEAAKLARFSTGKGLGILDQILELYKLLHRKKIIYYINDLKDNQKAAGTLVDIYIPQ